MTRPRKHNSECRENLRKKVVDAALGIAEPSKLAVAHFWVCFECRAACFQAIMSLMTNEEWQKIRREIYG